MKKILLITAMFMATSVWSDYHVCSFKEMDDLTECVNTYIDWGYEPHGSLVSSSSGSYNSVRYIQPMISGD